VICGQRGRALQKFTSKERDIETALDYFLARYYSSAQGRFTSPDDVPPWPARVLEKRGQACDFAIRYLKGAIPRGGVMMGSKNTIVDVRVAKP
jgi:RHS repeat-associated protein